MENFPAPNRIEPSPQAARPAKALRLLGTLAMLALMTGLLALVISLTSSSLSGFARVKQAGETVYPAQPTQTNSGDNGPAGADAYPAPATATPGAPYPGPATATPGQPYPGPATATPGEPYPGPVVTTPAPATATPGEFSPAEASQPTVTSWTPAAPESLAMSNWCVPWNSASQVALVKKVIDGATIEIEVDGKPVQVRYIGVELPDVEGSLAYDQATRANRRLVEGKRVTLIKESSEKNQQGQWVRYVLVEGVFVNHELIRKGYVRANSYPPDVGCDVFFSEAQRLAQATGLGIWTLAITPTRTLVPSATPAATSGDVRVVFIEPRGDGWQDPNEFVEIRNHSPFGVQLAGWTLSDEKGHKFTFPNLLLISGGYCRIYTNLYKPETCGLSFYSLSPVWDDDGDCAYLRDPQGNLVSQFCY